MKLEFRGKVSKEKSMILVANGTGSRNRNVPFAAADRYLRSFNESCHSQEDFVCTGRNLGPRHTHKRAIKKIRSSLLADIESQTSGTFARQHSLLDFSSTLTVKLTSAGAEEFLSVGHDPYLQLTLVHLRKLAPKLAHDRATLCHQSYTPVVVD